MSSFRTESLNVRSMGKNHNLAQAISHTGWDLFVRMLEYRTTLYGKKLVPIGRWYPSTKTCSGCKDTMEPLPLDVRKWGVPAAGQNTTAT
ncbi:hypothetical protein AWN76_012380 [Rhodothermaceae bacterium RA]|nr:hypothetical protein AWN76_012380 [Rhodothermaceae bacterium RA]